MIAEKGIKSVTRLMAIILTVKHWKSCRNSRMNLLKRTIWEQLAKQQEALRKVNEQIAKDSFNGKDTSGLEAQKSSIESNISSLQDLAMQYKAATSAYQQWQSAMSGSEEGDMYDSIQGNLESVQELYDQGLVGTSKSVSLSI